MRLTVTIIEVDSAEQYREQWALYYPSPLNKELSVDSHSIGTEEIPAW
jgi:hypothetical protein